VSIASQKSNIRALHKIILILLSVIIAFGISELGINFYLSIYPRAKKKFVNFLYNEEQPHPYCAYQVPIDYPAAKRRDPNEFIIVFSGGSTAYGVGASSEDKKIASRLEWYLNERNPYEGISRFRVINAANPSYHTTQEKNVFL